MRWQFKLANLMHPWIYRLRRGRGVDRVRGAPVLLVTTTGRKSGRPHTVAVAYVRDGDDLVVVGSAGGLPHHPAWVLNLRDRPEADVQLGEQRFRVRSEWLSGEDHERTWARVVQQYPWFADYQRKASRTIPLVPLHPPQATTAPSHAGASAPKRPGGPAHA